MVEQAACYVERIRAVYPELPVERVSVNCEGQYNVVLVVDDALVFRFPRFNEGVRRLAMETAILRGIRRYVTLPVPDPIYTSFDIERVGEVFAGYRLLPGEPLRHETVRAIEDEGTLQRLAAQLGTFLRELHAVPVAEAIAYPLPALDAGGWYARWRDLDARIRERVYPHLGTAARRRVADHFEPVLADPGALAFRPVLVHGDFGAGNILFDARQGRITGIVDFGSSAPGDPAVDVAALSIYDEPFLRRALAAYPEMAAMLGRARFYRGTFALQEALYGAEHGDPAALERGIAGYRD